MSLVAYDASSESDDESDNEASKAIIVSNTLAAIVPQFPQSKSAFSNGHISDDDDFISDVEDKENGSAVSLSSLLPKPKNNTNPAENFENFAKPTFSVLPAPKAIDSQVDNEEDDVFLHKKPNVVIEKPDKNNRVKKMPVKISVPSLKNFRDVEKEIENKAKNKSINSHSRLAGSSGLLSILPKAKSEQNFAIAASSLNKDNKTVSAANPVQPVIPCFVPDAVRHKRPATNTEDIDRLKPNKKKLKNQTNRTPVQSGKKVDSDESDDDNTDTGDFFSFTSDQSLPEVSATEIDALVAKKAAKIVETTTNYLKANESQKLNYVEEMQIDAQELESSKKRYHQEQQLNSEAIQALVGSSTKRRRQQQSDIQVIDINSSQVLPNKDEWMRTALASSTTYQPTGVLVDEEPASGTRRKHQITYLAHKAKANEAELQAMWSANRQNRRATQSKYGF